MYIHQSSSDIYMEQVATLLGSKKKILQTWLPAANVLL